MPFKSVDGALQRYRSGQQCSLRRAAIASKVPRTTMRDLNRGRLPRTEAFAHLQLVLSSDEKAIAKYI